MSQSTEESAPTNAPISPDAPRIVMGLAGFMIFVVSAPCLLFFIGGGYVTGLDDSSGMFGIVALGLLGLFLGFTLLWKAIRRPPPKRGAAEISIGE